MTNAKGIDVSSWQAETPPLAGLSFLIARASIGTGKDARYAHHIANAKAAGLVTGGYHFNDNGVSSTTQADIFLEAAGDVDLYFVDVEGNQAFSQNQTKAFIDRCHAKGGIFLQHQSHDARHMRRGHRGAAQEEVAVAVALIHLVGADRP